VDADAGRRRRRWYGRGTADNKGQHSINIAALAQVLAARGRLGFNVKWLIEMGEETGSPGLADFCAAQRDGAGRRRADRQRRPAPARRPAHGVPGFARRHQLRAGAEAARRRPPLGNWGGLLRNPGTVLANAIASLVDARGGIRCRACGRRPSRPTVRARWPTSRWAAARATPRWTPAGASPA
jgi:hypothetical protein